MKVDYDEDQRWLVMHRGSLSIVCNLNADAVTVPVTGEPVLAWGEPTFDSDSLRLEGHSVRCSADAYQRPRVNDLIERPPSRLPIRLERPVVGISEGQQIGNQMVAGHPQDGASLLLVAHR
jgi:hypothetical protein